MIFLCPCQGNLINWNIKNQIPAIAFQIIENSQPCPTMLHCYRTLRAVDGLCTQNKPSALLTVRIDFLVMNNRWISEKQGDNELTCSPLGPSLSLASAILYKKKKTKFFHLKSSYGNSAVKNDQEVWKHKRSIRVDLHDLYSDWIMLCRAVTKISSCLVNTTSRQGIKQLGISFGSIFLLFSYESIRGPHS